ncbi:hypothetical protein [Sinorhizobium meliloti]|uniref:hypothetical protein n=1 Tax=Rhizobium meliloti TaxID=382 RepID=UPI000FD5FFFD|nr:hypothetical protein [Sinorhizobium meliloti]RVR13206.1 hypothetical protein CN243_01100 [Sinorhizobium meliloti]
MNRELLGALLFGSILLSGCGLVVPQKDPIRGNPTDARGRTRQGKMESNIIANVRCEVTKGLFEAVQTNHVPWLKGWGTKITLDLTWDELSNVNPSFSYAGPISTGKTFSLGTGLQLSARATRQEQITFTLDNSVLLLEAELTQRARGSLSCTALQDGTQVYSDLDIDGFILDKTTIAGGHEATTRTIEYPQFSTFTQKLTFVASYGGSVTPGWKLVRTSYNPNGNFLQASRTKTNLIVVTLGPLETPLSKTAGPELTQQARVIHNANLVGAMAAPAFVAIQPNQ